MRRFLWVWPIAAVILVFLVPWSCHRLKGDRAMNIVVVDKTVPFENRIEHRSLFWLLEHLKIVRPDGEPYDRDLDYLGAFPGPVPGDPPARTENLSTPHVEGIELLYLADTYGVYEEDLESGAEMRAALERSPRVYGGLNLAEVDAVEHALDQGIPVIAEFNTLGSPTGSAARHRLETLLGVRWTRWIGRFFSELSSREEVPQWMRDNYEREWNRPWLFEGPGYVLLQDDDHCEVLRVGTEAHRIGLTLSRSRPTDPLLARARDRVPYPYWFDIVVAAGDAEVLARFQWNLTEEGMARLQDRELPESFPAVVRRTHGGTPSYYFAGDFADNPMSDRAIPLSGYLGFKRRIESFKLAPSKDSFYWTFYVPMMTELLHRTPPSR